MSNSIVSNKSSFNSGLDAHYARFEKRFSLRMKTLMEAAMVRLLRRTPVNTGSAVMSYVASADQPFSGPYSRGFDPVEPTNDIPLGTEKLRSSAEAVALATLGRVDYSEPFTTYWITNNAPHIAGLESGDLPDEPYTPRSPQGMFGVTLQEISALLDGGII